MCRNSGRPFILQDFHVSGESDYDKIISPTKHVLRQSPRSGVRDHRVGEVRNRRHHLDLVFGSRGFEPDTTLLGTGDVP